MKKGFYLFLLLIFSISCKDDGIDPNIPAIELISQNNWKLDRFSTINGEPINNSDLNSQALLLYVMDFEFKSNGEVRGVDKSSGQIIDRGVWQFINGETSVNVKLGILDYDFQIIVLKTGKLTLQAPTGNFLSGLGDQINLEFSSSN